jgi:hypothetical protein
MQGQQAESVISLFRISDSMVSRDIQGIKSIFDKFMAKFPKLMIKAGLDDSLIRSSMQNINNITKDQTMNIKATVSGASGAASELDKVMKEAHNVPSTVDVKVNTSGAKQAKKDLGDVDEAMKKTEKGAGDLRDAMTTAFAMLAGGAVMGKALGVEELNKEFDLMDQRLKGLTIGKINDKELKILRESARQSYVQAGQDVKGAVNDTIDLYSALNNAQQAASAKLILAQAAKVKGLDPSEVTKAYISATQAYSNQDPGQVLQQFVGFLQLTPNIKDQLDTINEYPASLKSTFKTFGEFAAVGIEFGKSQFNLDKPLDAVKELGLRLSATGDASKVVLAKLFASGEDKQFVKGIQDSYSKLEQVPAGQANVLKAFAAEQHKSTDTIFQALRDGDDATVAAFYSRQSMFIQSINNGQIDQQAISKAVVGKYKGLSILEKQKFIVSLGIPQLEDKGVDATQKILEAMANIEASSQQFNKNIANSGDELTKQVDESKTVLETIAQVWKDFSTSSGVTSLMDSVVPTIKEFIGWIATGMIWLSNWMLAHKELAKVIFWVVFTIGVLIGILLLFGTVMSAVGAASLFFEAGLAAIGLEGVTVAGIFGVIRTAIFGIGNFFLSAGKVLLWFGNFILRTIIIGGLEALAAAVGISVGALLGIIAAVVAVVAAIVIYWDQIKQFAMDTINLIKSLGPRLFAIMKDIGISILQGLMTPMRLLSNLLGSLFDALGLPSGIFKDIQKMSDSLEGMKTKVDVGQLVGDAVSGTAKNFSTLGQGVKERTKEVMDGVKGSLGGMFNFGGGSKSNATPTPDQKAPDMSTTDDELAKLNGNLQKFDAQALMDSARSNKAPTVDTAAGVGLPNIDIKPQPVQQTNNIYNPYDDKKVNNNLNANKRSGDQSIGRRAVPTCG